MWLSESEDEEMRREEKRREDKNRENVRNCGEIECNGGRCHDALSRMGLCVRKGHMRLFLPPSYSLADAQRAIRAGEG